MTSLSSSSAAAPASATARTRSGSASSSRTTHHPPGFSAPAAEIMPCRSAVASAPSGWPPPPKMGSRRSVSAASRPRTIDVARYSKASSSGGGAADGADSTRSTPSAGRYCPTTDARARSQRTLAADIPPSSPKSAAKRASCRSPRPPIAARTPWKASSKACHTLTSRWCRLAGCLTWPPLIRSDATRPGYPFRRLAGRRHAARASFMTATTAVSRSSVSILARMACSAYRFRGV